MSLLNVNLPTASYDKRLFTSLWNLIPPVVFIIVVINPKPGFQFWVFAIVEK